MQSETLEQFWHSLNGMASECDFGAQSQSLVHDIFILNMKNLAVQEKLCTEPKASPKVALDVAIAYEEGTLRQKLYGDTKVSIKNEPICVVTKKKDCLRCGTENVSMEHLKVCPAKGKKCNKCGILGHFGLVCRKQQEQQTPQKQALRRVNWVDEESDNQVEEEEGQYVLGIDCGGSPPLMMKGKINRKKFCLMIDSGSPVTKINQKEVQKILQYEVLFVRALPKDEKYVDNNKKPVNLLGYICELEVGDEYIRKARILVARPGAKSIVGRDWLNYLQYRIEPKSKFSNSINCISKTLQTCPLVKEMQAEFLDLFARQGRIKHHKILARLHEGTVIKQQKGRRVPIQLQEYVKKGNKSVTARRPYRQSARHQRRCLLTAHSDYGQERSERQNSPGRKKIE